MSLNAGEERPLRISMHGASCPPLSLSQHRASQIRELAGLEGLPAGACLLRALTYFGLGLSALLPISDGIAESFGSDNITLSPELTQRLPGIAGGGAEANQAEALDRLLYRLLFGLEKEDGQAPLALPQWREDSVSLKVWLPDSVLSALKAYAVEADASLSDVLRNILLVEFFGLLGVARAVGTGIWRTRRRSVEPDGGGILFSRRQASRSHGKPTEATRFWAPTALGDRIKEQAAAEGLPTSEWMRLVFIRAAFGSSYKAPA